MSHRTRFLGVLGTLLLLGTAQAQLSVRLKMGKNNFLAGEPVPVEITVSNLSGQEVTLAGSNLDPWLSLMVSSSRGTPMTPISGAAFGAVRIPSGRALARTVDLNQMFPLATLGNYSVYASIRAGGPSGGRFQSNRVLFTVNNAVPYWKQTVGVPGRRGQTNEYRLIRFSNSQRTELYVQVADARNGHILSTHSLGEALMLHKPAVTIDSALTMHVLYMINPKYWGHARVSPEGKFLGRDLYESTDASTPVLAQMKDGSVRTLGGAAYDPKAAQEAARRRRNASDRPDFIYR